MSNSSLVNYIKISPHKSPRKGTIKKIAVHHMAGKLSVETCGNVFQANKASANYGIGYDGRVGMYAEEKDRAWATANPENDHQAVNIEVSNDEIGGNWHVPDVALAKLIDLCVDICKRNDIDKLNYTGDATGNLVMHKYFMATTCPGPYLESKFPYIAEEVNKRLITEKKPSKSDGLKVGDIISFKGGKHYTGSNSSVGYAVSASKARITATNPGSKHPIHLRAVNDAGNYTYGVYGWVDLSTIDGDLDDTPKVPALTDLTVGDIVSFVGNTHYVNASATAKGYSVNPCKAKVTSKYPSGKHQVHLRAVNDNGAYISGVYGWVDLKDIRV